MNKKQLFLLFDELISTREGVLYTFVDVADICVRARKNMRSRTKRQLQSVLRDLEIGSYDEKENLRETISALQSELNELKTTRGKK